MKKIAATSCQACGQCINQVHLFDNLSEAQQMEIMRHAQHETLPKNSILFHPDEHVQQLIVIRQGKLKLSNYDAKGREYIYDILTAGSVWGEDTLFSQARCGMYAEALTELHICRLTLQVLEELLRNNSHFALQLIRLLGQRATDQQERIRLLSISDSTRRLAQFLVARSDHLGNDPIELSQETIAAAVNLSRETVSRKLSQLVDEGLIAHDGYKKIKIIHKEKLKAY